MPAIPTLIRSAAEMSAFSKSADNGPVALVPTMGALHRGHIELVAQAKRRAKAVIVSIFVNPTQFAPHEDLDQYPRELGADMESLKDVGGVDAVFAPTVEEMYPDGWQNQKIWVTPTDMADGLCGAFRPGHFQGVATIVAKLFSICAPDLAFFGMKDAQQLVILKKMVRDLGFQLEIVGVPTVREADGLAFSSRNRYLSAAEREEAVVVSKAVRAAAEAVAGGESSPEAIRALMREMVNESALAELQYAEVVDAATLRPLKEIISGQHVLSAMGVYFGATRLIDNSFSIAR